MVKKIEFIYNKNNNFHIIIYIPAGSIYESDENRGISHMLEHMVFKHTKQYNELGLLKEITSLGGSYNAVTDRDTTFYYIMTNSDNYKKSCDILHTIICEPIFNSHELEVERKVVLEEINKRQDNDSDLFNLSYLTILKSDNKYAYPIEGYAKTLNNLTVKDLIKYYKEHYSEFNIIINCDYKIKDDVEKYVFHKFGPNKDVNFTNIGLIYGNLSFESRLFVIKKNYSQFTTHLLFPSFPRSMIKEKTILTFIRYFLSASGLYSILMSELRTKRGLIYGISSINEVYRYLGIYRIAISTSDKNTELIINIVLDILQKLKSNGLDKKKLNYYKKSFLNEQKYAFTNTEFVTALKGEQLFYDCDIEYSSYSNIIKNITNDDIKNISKMVFDFNKIGILTYGDYKNLKTIKSQIINLVDTYINLT
jgi:predicted Zn-dependent peptidase